MAKSIVEKYEQILAADPASMVFVELAKALIDRAENPRAVEICRQGVLHHPDSIVGRVLWGKALLNSGGVDEAMGQFDAAVALDRENPYAYNLIGEVLLHKGMYRAALPILEKASQLQPGDTRVQQWLRQVKQRLGDDGEATGRTEVTAPARPSQADGDDEATVRVDSPLRDPFKADTDASDDEATVIDDVTRRGNTQIRWDPRLAHPGAGESEVTAAGGSPIAEASTAPPASGATAATGNSDEPPVVTAVAPSGASPSVTAPMPEGVSPAPVPAPEMRQARVERTEDLPFFPDRSASGPKKIEDGTSKPPPLPPQKRETTNPRIELSGYRVPGRDITNPRFVLSMIPDAATGEQKAPDAAAVPVPNPDEATKIAAQYETELRERLMAATTAKPRGFFRRHWLGISAISLLVLVGGGGGTTYWWVRRLNRSTEVRRGLEKSRTGLARDTFGALRDAARLLEDIRDAAPSNHEAASLSAQVSGLLWRDFGDADARKVAEKALTEGNTGDGALVAKYLLADNPAEQAAAGGALVGSSSTSPLALDLAGQALLAKGDLQGAVARFESAAKSTPPSLRALADLGDFYKDQGNLDQALTYYRTAHSAHPTHPRAVIGAAEVRLQLGRDLKEALDELKGIETDTASPPRAGDRLRFEIAYAKLLAATGERAAAVDRFVRATEKMVNRPEVPSTLAEIYALSGAHDRAEAEAARAVKMAPKDPSYRVLLAKALIARSRYREAITRTEGVESRQLHLYRGIARYELHDYRGARLEFEQTKRESRMLAEAAVYYALVDLAMGNREQAKAVLEKLTTTKNPQALAYVALGRLAQAEGRAGDAENDYRMAVQRDATHVEGHCALGRLLVERGQAQDALPLLVRAATLNPFHVEARLALGQAKLALADPSGAKVEFQAVLSEESRNGNGLRGLSAALLASHEPSDARRVGERAVRADARNPESWLAVGRAALAQGDERVAVKSLDRARDLAPRNGGTLGLLGEAYLRANSLPQARKSFDAALHIDSKDVTAHVGLGRVLLALHDIKGSLRELQTAADLIQKTTDRSIVARLHAVRARALLLGPKSDWAKAEKEARAGVTAWDGSSEAHFALAQVLDSKDLVEAKSHYQRALELEPGSPEFRFALGALLLREGKDPAAAARELSEYLRLAPRGSEATTARRLIAEANRKIR